MLHYQHEVFEKYKVHNVDNFSEMILHIDFKKIVLMNITKPMLFYSSYLWIYCNFKFDDFSFNV